jgi:hypothetical protein
MRFIPVAVRAQRDHGCGVVSTASCVVVNMVHLKQRLTGLCPIRQVRQKTRRVLTPLAAAKQHGLSCCPTPHSHFTARLPPSLIVTCLLPLRRTPTKKLVPSFGADDNGQPSWRVRLCVQPGNTACFSCASVHRAERMRLGHDERGPAARTRLSVHHEQSPRPPEGLLHNQPGFHRLARTDGQEARPHAELAKGAAAASTCDPGHEASVEHGTVGFESVLVLIPRQPRRQILTTRFPHGPSPPTSTSAASGPCCQTRLT